MSNLLTFVPYGNQMVPLPGGIEPRQNTQCPFCDKLLPISTFADDVIGFEDGRGVVWCNEGCEMFARLDQRQFFLRHINQAISYGHEAVAAHYAKQLTTFSRAFDEVRENTEWAFA